MDAINRLCKMDYYSHTPVKFIGAGFCRYRTIGRRPDGRFFAGPTIWAIPGTQSIVLALRVLTNTTYK